MGQDRVHEPPSRFQLPVCFPPSCSYTGGPSSSCEMIILRNKIISQLSPQFPHNKSYYLGLSTWQHQKRPLTDSFRLYEALLLATRNRTLSATPIISEGVWSYLFSSIWHLSPWGWKQEGFTPDWLNIRVKIDDSPHGWKTHLEKIYLKTHWLGAIHSARWVSSQKNRYQFYSILCSISCQNSCQASGFLEYSFMTVTGK